MRRIKDNNNYYYDNYCSNFSIRFIVVAGKLGQSLVINGAARPQKLDFDH